MKHYSFDTSAFLDMWVRHYPPDVFPALWDRLDGAATAGMVIASETVLDELERLEDEAHAWAKAHRKMFVELDEDVQADVRLIMQQHPRFCGQGRPTKNFADPFVIALAKQRECCVVTAESGGGPNNPKIPFVCGEYSIECLTVVDFLRQMEWRF